MQIKVLLFLLLLLLPLLVLAQSENYAPEPHTPEDNWCYAGGPWGDGRCNHPDPYINQFNWVIGWFMPRCEADVFPQDQLPAPCVAQEKAKRAANGDDDDEIVVDDDVIIPGVDNDGDGLPDWWEIQEFGNTSYGASDDLDSDNCSNLCEYQQGTQPTNPDTDGDSLLDGDELPNSSPTDADTDGDGYDDGVEVAAGSNPRDPGSIP